MATLKKYRYHYTVIGRGVFPYDMLRYDRCYPVNSRDVEEMTIDKTRQPNKTREVTVSSEHYPTTARWESFGYSVHNLEKIPVEH